MAHSTLPVLTHPSFPQVFAAAISAEVNRVCFPVPTQPQLSICCFTSPESSWGACDSIECRDVATVHDVATELDYCARHFRAVRRG
jgi:hypothetical protein